MTGQGTNRAAGSLQLMGARALVVTILVGVVVGALVYLFDPVDLLGGNGDTPTASGPTSSTTQSSTTTAPPRPECDPPAPTPLELVGSLTEQSVALSENLFSCSDTVVVSRPGAAGESVAIAVAAAAPLLIYTPDNADRVLRELDRLDPISILSTSPSLDLGHSIEVVDPQIPDPVADASVWFVKDTTTDPVLMDLLARLAHARPIIGERIDDLSEEALAALQMADEVVTVGASDPEFEWRLSVVRSGVTNPGGGVDLIDDTRFVALYGNPTTSALGVLGEQGPTAGLTRLAPILEQYEADGVTAVPTFEIIVTVADAVPGADGDYSAEMSPDVLRPWIDAAGEAGGYVLLDLQPGRTDFLTQAMIYEDLLRLPHVGLALDPEWRLEPDEFHLRQIGSVDAAEINLVSEWLARIVREEALPQKMFLLHQFRLDMITNRPAVELRPELATVIQMDGQGPIGTKYETYAVLTRQADADRYWWGWKNFYDEDTPTPTPAQVLDLDPVPVYVSYQ